MFRLVYKQKRNGNSKLVCKSCKNPNDMAITRQSQSTQKYYCVPCARKLNILTTEIWWNKLKKYSRWCILTSFRENQEGISMDLAEEYSEKRYKNLPEEIKFTVDVYNLKREKL
jgi:hypothetical protein